MGETKVIKVRPGTIISIILIVLLIAGCGALYYFGFVEKGKQVEAAEAESKELKAKNVELEKQIAVVEGEKTALEEKEMTEEEAIKWYSETGEKLFEEYLSKQDDLKSYKINSCKMIYYYNDEFVCGVDYDVEPDGNVEESKWLAGNGEISGNTIKGKGVFLEFKKVNGEYIYNEEAGQSTSWVLE